MLVWGKVTPVLGLEMVRRLPLALAAAALMQIPALAQSGSYMLGPGSNVGEATEVKEDNCVTASDGLLQEAHGRPRTDFQRWRIVLYDGLRRNLVSQFNAQVVENMWSVHRVLLLETGEDRTIRSHYLRYREGD